MIFIIWWSLFHKLEGYLYFYLQMTGMLFLPGTLVSGAIPIFLDFRETWFMSSSHKYNC